MSDEQIGPRRRELAGRLKSLRRDSGLSAERLAAQLDWSQSKVSKIENGRTRPTPTDVVAFAQALGAKRAVVAELIELARAAETEATTWRSLYRRGFDQRQRHYAEMEAEAAELLIYQPSVIPGLFQTADYARRVIGSFGIDPAEIGEAVVSRLERQRVLYDEAKHIDVVITEAALWWRPGPVGVSLAQLDRLDSLVTLPNVELGIVPLDVGGSEIPLNQFVIFKLGADLDAVTVETYTSEVTVTDPEGVAAYEAIFKRHRASAVYDQEARTLIERVRQHLLANP